MAQKKKPEIARIDAATPESRIFKVRPKGGPRLLAEEYTHTIQTDDGPLDIKFATPYPLNDVDLRIFLAAVGLCSDGPTSLNQNDAGPIQRHLWDTFVTTGEALGKEGAFTRTTSYALCQAAGLTWGKKTSQRITESLRRMTAVTSSWRRGNQETSGSRMLSYAHDEDSGELALGISPLFAQAILGNAQRYVKVNLAEVRQLKHPASTIIHMIMSSRMGLGSKRKKRDLTISIDILTETVYGPHTSSAQKRERRKKIKPAFEELHSLGGWHVFYNLETGKVNFTRETPKSLEYAMRNAERIEGEINEED